jgi:hypothetical protein
MLFQFSRPRLSRPRRYFFSALFCLVLPVASQAQVNTPVELGIIRHTEINEPSGMVKGKGLEDLYWLVNRTGADPRVFAIRSDGTSVIPTFSKFSRWFDEPEEGKQPWEGFRLLYAEQGQWLDMTSDENYLYIYDGSKQSDSDAVIFAFGEIDPTASTQAAVIKRLAVNFPAPEIRPDSGAILSVGNAIYLLAESPTGGVSLYGLVTDNTDAVNTLVLMAEDETLTDVQAAEVSPDGSRLAVLTGEAVFIYSVSSDAEWLADRLETIPLELTAEAGNTSTLTWQSAETIMLGMTSGNLYTIQVD